MAFGKLTENYKGLQLNVSSTLSFTTKPNLASLILDIYTKTSIMNP